MKSRGGGGGMGSAGVTATSTVGGNGGDGIVSYITGPAVYYGAGGAGLGDTGGMGTPGTGYGNYGSGGNAQSLGTQGCVIIRYAGSQVFSGGSISTSGGYTIHTFTSSGNLTR